MRINEIIQYNIITGICKDEFSFTLLRNVNVLNIVLFVFLNFLVQYDPFF